VLGCIALVQRVRVPSTIAVGRAAVGDTIVGYVVLALMILFDILLLASLITLS
jgi:hypothetical protein